MRRFFAAGLALTLGLGVLSGTALAEEREGIELHGDSTYDSIQKITDEDITLKIMLAIRDTDTLDPPAELGAIQDLEALTGIKTEWEVIKGSDGLRKLLPDSKRGRP